MRDRIISVRQKWIPRHAEGPVGVLVPPVPVGGRPVLSLWVEAARRVTNGAVKLFTNGAISLAGMHRVQSVPLKWVIGFAVPVVQERHEFFLVMDLVDG